MKIILGSGSKSRRQILSDLGYEFEIVLPDIDEKSIRDADPSKLVLKIANAKADKVLKMVSGPYLIITGDQVVNCNGKILEKPVDAAQAREFIRGYHLYPLETVASV